MFRSLNRIIIMMVFLAGIISCSEDQSGAEDLIVSWNIAGVQVCKAYLPDDDFSQESISFDKVEILLFDAEDTDSPIQEPVIVPCKEYSYKISRLDVGRYTVRVDAKGKYEKKVLPFFTGSENFNISKGEKNGVDVALALGSGRAQVVWHFKEGLTCGVKHAGEVVSVAVDFAGKEIEAACGDGMIKMDNVKPGSSYKVKGEALDGDGKVLYKYSSGSTIKILPGETVDIDMDFK